MTTMVKVKAIKDQDGHWYVIPAEKLTEFISDEEAGEDDDYVSFNDKWGIYRTGGDLNNIQLYAEIPPQGDAGDE